MSETNDPSSKDPSTTAPAAPADAGAPAEAPPVDTSDKVGRNEVHTVKRDGAWVNTVDNEKVGPSRSRKATAVADGRNLARQNKAEHFVHGADGKIQQRNSYGNDPARRPG